MRNCRRDTVTLHKWSWNEERSNSILCAGPDTNMKSRGGNNMKRESFGPTISWDGIVYLTRGGHVDLRMASFPTITKGSNYVDVVLAHN